MTNIYYYVSNNTPKGFSTQQFDKIGYKTYHSGLYLKNGQQVYIVYDNTKKEIIDISDRNDTYEYEDNICFPCENFQIISTTL